MNVLSQKTYDRLVVCGDIVGYGADPSACIDIVYTQTSVVVAGNHDWAVSDRMGTDYFNDMAKHAIDWTKNRLSDQERELLHALPLEASVAGVHVVHSNPAHPESWTYLLDDDDVRCIRHAIDGIHIVGHSHVPFIYGFGSDGEEFNTEPDRYNLKSSWSYVINVGSIGQPRDGIPLASGALIDTDEGYIELLRQPYPIHRAAEKIRNEPELSDFLALRLFSGT